METNTVSKKELMSVMHSDTGKRFASRDMANTLGVETVTVRKYALALEKAGYVFERSSGDHRLFSERDAIAMQHLKALRERSGMSIETAAIAVTTRLSEASNSVTLAAKVDTTADFSHYKELYHALEAKIETLTQIILQQNEVATIKALQWPDLRDVQFNLRMTERRIERQLRAEAEKAWEAKPSEQRLCRVGFFRKQEDMVARNRFIMEYIDDQFEAKIRNEYDH